jgi:hypothetical protein
LIVQRGKAEQQKAKRQREGAANPTQALGIWKSRAKETAEPSNSDTIY